MRPPVSQATLAPGTLLAKRFRIEEVIGSGGYASVYRATDLTFGYERAIKEVTDPDRGVRTQFRLEAELLINTKHPNVPHGYHIIEDMGRMYLVMEYVRGKDLEELLNDSLTQKGRPLDEAQTLRWAIAICDALVEMHALKSPIIHRDIKPANIKITPEGRPVLIDFGLAKLQQGGSNNLPTQTAAQGVSPGFAPPEQYMAKGRTDARTDVYGLGATVYACLTGKDPAEAPARLLAQTGAGSNGSVLTSVRRLNSRVSEPTERVVMKALELSPGQRQQSARQLRDDLTDALRRLTGEAPMAAAATTASPAVRPASPANEAASKANQPGQTLVMGGACPRCGTPNRPDALTCVNCGASLRPGAPPLAQPAPSSGKRGVGQRGAPAAAVQGGSGKQQAMKAPMPAPRSIPPAAPAPVGTPIVVGAPAATLGQAAIPRTSGRQPAVNAAGAIAQPIRSTGKQAAVAIDQAPTLSPQNTAAVAAMGARGAVGVAAPPSGRNARSGGPGAVKAPGGAVALASPTTLPTIDHRAWIHPGTTPLSWLGKTFLTLSAVETLWGLTVVALGGYAIYAQGHTPSVTTLLELGGGWLAVAVIFSLLAGQAISRPVYRRGVIGNVQRTLRGFGLTVAVIVAHALAIWGALVFSSSSSAAPYALITYLVFGLVVLVAGVLSLINILG